jgi:hypothetical protein
MLCPGPHREGEEPKPMMYERGKSDSAVKAVKPANKVERSAAELVEQRPWSRRWTLGRLSSRQPGRLEGADAGLAPRVLRGKLRLAGTAVTAQCTAGDRRCGAIARDEPAPTTSLAGLRAAPTQTLGRVRRWARFSAVLPRSGRHRCIDPKHLPSEQRAMMKRRPAALNGQPAAPSDEHL